MSLYSVRVHACVLVNRAPKEKGELQYDPFISRHAIFVPAL